MTIPQLRCFTTVARLENVSQSAELLHLSQSSLSKSIAKLEEELGTPLFERRGKKLTLNAAGQRLLEYSTRTLRELERTKDDLRLIATGTETRIRIGTAWSGPPLMECIAAFHRLHPEAAFDLDSGIERCDRPDINDYDMLIYPAGQKYQKYKGTSLCEESYSLAVCKAHPLAEAGSVGPEELNGLSLVFLRSGSAWVEFPCQLCNALELRFASCCYADSRLLHRQMIVSGLSAGFVPDSVSDFYRDAPEVRLIPVRDRRFSRNILVCFRREKHLSPLARAFRDFAAGRLGLEQKQE
ncbi:MAG: LysR family transcriptional regulator [Oscillospiraceae bacterium]|nr:LysR family transcriptional regulator [Oscillospiraceae bacterium]